MLLSDRDITAAIAEGRLGIEPYDAGLVQPSSIDVRLDRFFRVFNNSRYTHIDPAAAAGRPDHPDRARRRRAVRAAPGRVRARLDARGRHASPTTSRRGSRARARWAGSGCSPTRPRASSTPGFSGHITLELSNVANLPITLWPGMKIGQLCMFRLTSAGRAPVRLGRLRLPLPGPARADAVPVVPQLHPRGDPPSGSLTCTLTGVSAPATSSTSVAVRRPMTSPGRTGSPRRRRTARAS